VTPHCRPAAPRGFTVFSFPAEVWIYQNSRNQPRRPESESPRKGGLRLFELLYAAKSKKGFKRGPVAGDYLHLSGRTGDVEEINPYDIYFMEQFS
jgi:hypothetical protein